MSHVNESGPILVPLRRSSSTGGMGNDNNNNNSNDNDNGTGKSDSNANEKGAIVNNTYALGNNPHNYNISHTTGNSTGNSTASITTSGDVDLVGNGNGNGNSNSNRNWRWDQEYSTARELGGVSALEVRATVITG